MILFEGKRIQQEEKVLLANDLSGRRILLHLKDSSVMSTFSNRFSITSERTKRLWTINTKGGPLLDCFLVERVQGGQFFDSVYEAIVSDNENDEIVGWSLVTIDEKHRSPEFYSDSINLRLFSFNTIAHNDEKILSSEQFELMILDRCPNSTLRHIRKSFELFEGAKVYNAIKSEDRQREIRHEIIGKRIEYYEEVIEGLRTLRSHSPKKYTELSYWKEHEFREKARDARVELFGVDAAFIGVDEIWFNKIRPLIQSKVITVEKDSEIVVRVRDGRIINREDLEPNALFVVIERISLFDDGKSQSYSISLYRCANEKDDEKNAMHYDEDQVEVIQNLRVDMNELPFEYIKDTRS